NPKFKSERDEERKQGERRKGRPLFPLFSPVLSASDEFFSKSEPLLSSAGLSSHGPRQTTAAKVEARHQAGRQQAAAAIPQAAARGKTRRCSLRGVRFWPG